MPEETKQPQQPFEWVESKQGNVPDVYGNFVHASWTLVDVRFQIGHLIPKKVGDVTAGFVVEDRGAVTIAWPQAKFLRDLVVALVASYEQVNGEIKPLAIPPTPENLIPNPTTE